MIVLYPDWRVRASTIPGARQEVGLTPAKFVELSRLENARHYLEQSTMTIGEVAEACG